MIRTHKQAIKRLSEEVEKLAPFEKLAFVHTHAPSETLQQLKDLHWKFLTKQSRHPGGRGYTGHWFPYWAWCSWRIPGCDTVMVRASNIKFIDLEIMPVYRLIVSMAFQNSFDLDVQAANMLPSLYFCLQLTPYQQL